MSKSLILAHVHCKVPGLINMATSFRMQRIYQSRAEARGVGDHRTINSVEKYHRLLRQFRQCAFGPEPR